MTTSYKILFMVDLLNEYYNNFQCRDFSILASAETTQVLQDHQMVFKIIGNKLVVLAKVQTDAENEDKLMMPIASDTRFLFYLSLNEPLFTTVTNLNVDGLRLNHRYYFSNLNQNRSGDSLHLSRRIKEYKRTNAYNPGDLVDDGDGIIYECIQKTFSGIDIGDPAFWFHRGPVQYVSSNDLVNCIARNNRFQTTAAAKKFTIEVFGLDTSTHQYTLPIPITKNRVLSEVATKDVLVDLSELLPSRYKVQINTDVFDVFVDDAMISQNLFGVIEIFNCIPAASDFALLDSTGKVKDTLVGGNLQWLRYQVRFANRLAGASTQIVQQEPDNVEQEIKRYHDEPNMKPVNFPQLFVEAFIYFLQHGHLPWGSPVTNHHVWQEELENLLITGFDEKTKGELVQLLKQPDVQQRILYQVPDEVFIKLMVQINAGIEKDITNLINDIKHLVTDAEERKTVLILFRQSVITFIYEVSSHQFAGHVYAHFVHQLSAQGNLRHIQIRKGKLRNTVLKKAIPAMRWRTTTDDRNAEYEHKALSYETNKNKIKQEGIYIQNAGLIIIAPFLPVFFKKLGLYDGVVITDKSRAVYVLQYIASGRIWVAEFELGLAKILCGMESDTPVETYFQLTHEEKTAINDLLLSTIEYWSILKDTSPDGLQHTFLQRAGKLQFINNEWKLQIEPKACDVLLQHFPWNVNMIKLPWMPFMLKMDGVYKEYHKQDMSF
ncbi:MULTISPECIES: contractile injection system tape measure protein [Niastella]|uniref:DUF2357 domain-containing protein n=1 Tax=Niastella soli TaxID=2821487 RepID=A0ABS3Z469_9BACT|nr:contractile injection system tape measure protein [Niastella soli]MBO9204968.1 hypothetical protein [Niastella soli]